MTTKTPTRQRKEKAMTPVEKPEVVPVTDEKPFDAFIEHQKKAIEEAGKALVALLPEDFKEHGQSAFKEVVEGYRRLFNAAIDELIDTMEKAKLQKSEKVAEEKDATPVP
jgi:cytochrome c556